MEWYVKSEKKRQQRNKKDGKAREENQERDRYWKPEQEFFKKVEVVSQDQTHFHCQVSEALKMFSGLYHEVSVVIWRRQCQGHGLLQAEDLVGGACECQRHTLNPIVLLKYRVEETEFFSFFQCIANRCICRIEGCLVNTSERDNGKWTNGSWVTYFQRLNMFESTIPFVQFPFVTCGRSHFPVGEMLTFTAFPALTCLKGSNKTISEE